MQKLWHIILFFLICIGLGILGGILLAYFVKPQSISHIPTPLIEDVPIGQQTIPQVVTASPQTTPPPVTVTQTITETPAPPKETTEAPVVSSLCPKPTDQNQPDEWLAPVGPDFGIGNYIPAHLVPLRDYVTTSHAVCLNQSAAVQLMNMEKVMHAEKLHIIVSSGYRDPNYQTDLRDASEAKRDPTTTPYPFVALPGHSEHQLGMAVDVVAGPTYTLGDFITTPEYAWLHDHSWEYGFIQSYPPGSEAITGYSTESWHFRYVGLANALAIHNQNITTYQYLQNLAKIGTVAN